MTRDADVLARQQRDSQGNCSEKAGEGEAKEREGGKGSEGEGRAGAGSAVGFNHHHHDPTPFLSSRTADTADRHTRQEQLER